MSDLISRQAAIDGLKRISFSHWFECGEYLSEDTREIEIISSKKALEVIEALPSAQPEYTEQDVRDSFNSGYACGMEAAQSEIIRCRDCRYGVDYYHDGNCYCAKPGYELLYFDGSWDFYCANAERREG